ncbi:MAG TPA: addiction module toxin RelE [Cyanobacteria bacterium UBA8543]|nr:addiction module toxin RelE [Cyanobacteria bacterium UBA8543]
MTSEQPYELIYAPEVLQHLRAIDRKYHSLIRATIEEQLRYEPEAETRNRKPLQRPSQIGAKWELRFGINNQFRVFYRTDASTRGVYILVICIKIGNKLLINNEEFEL